MMLPFTFRKVVALVIGIAGVFLAFSILEYGKQHDFSPVLLVLEFFAMLAVYGIAGYFALRLLRKRTAKPNHS